MTSDMRGKNIVTWNIACSQIRHVTLGSISDRDMRHWHFLKIDRRHGDPRQGPEPGRKDRLLGGWGGNNSGGSDGRREVMTGRSGGERVSSGCQGK